MSTELRDNAVVEVRIRNFLASIGEQIPQETFEDVVELLDVGEFRVAVENLCEQLSAERVRVTSSQHGDLLEVVRFLRVDERRLAGVRIGPEA